MFFDLQCIHWITVNRKQSTTFLNDAVWAIKKQAQSIREHFLHQTEFEPSGVRKLVLASEQSIDSEAGMLLVPCSLIYLLRAEYEESER